MLRDLDETIKQILIKAGDFDPADVDISFDIPTREWSSGIQKPTLNCYLFDIHERRMLREEGWQVNGRGTNHATRRQPPLFYEITYLITAWTRLVEDEHDLLWQILHTLARFPVLNDPNIFLDSVDPHQPGQQLLTECLVGSLINYALPISSTVAQLEGVLKSPGEFWTALENHLKPSLSYVVTLGLDRQAVAAGKPVRSTGINIRIPDSTADLGFRINRIFSLPPNTAINNVAVEFEGTGITVRTDEQGMFKPEGVAPGRYMAIVRIADQLYRRMLIIRDSAKQSRGTALRDIIRDQDGQPLDGILVEIEGTNLRATTDKDGAFSFDLLPGRYTLRIHMPGWSQRRQVMLRDPGHTLPLNYGGVPAGEQ